MAEGGAPLAESDLRAAKRMIQLPPAEFKFGMLRLSE